METELKNIEIHRIKESDIPEIVDIWYEASIQAHSFIPDNYWKENKKSMKEKYIPMSDTFLAIDGETILGFISLIDDYLAGLFVRPRRQNKGIGNLLLNYAKLYHNNLQLKVFCKNRRSVEFYKLKGFSIVSELKDEGTGENEFLMQWRK